MGGEKVHIFQKHHGKSPRLVIGFSGWMNSGQISTSSVEWLVRVLGATRTAGIAPNGFYIYNLPGNMEVAAEFRPDIRIVDGLVAYYHEPQNLFYYDKSNDLLLFLGKEPNMNWDEFADCIFAVCHDYSVKEIYFVGSVAGLVPHTRESKIICTLSDKKFRNEFAGHGFKFANYKGPASFITHLIVQAAQRGIVMANLIITVPAYVQGENPKCVEVIIRHLKNMLGLKVKLRSLRNLSDEFEKKLDEVINDMPDLAESIEKLEEVYDKEILDQDMPELKAWLEERGVQLD